MTCLDRIRILWTLPALLLSACSATGMLNMLSDKSVYQLSSNIAYGPGPRQQLDVYSPLEKNGQAIPNAPVVIFFYGGSWNSGEKSDYAFVAQALASRGIQTVIANYRLYPEVRYPEFLNDCAQAVDWVMREISSYGGNKNRLYAMGHSAGAYNASMLVADPRWLNSVGLNPSLWSGWVGIAGPYDFLPINTLEVRPVFFHPNYPKGSQPIDYLSSATPPTLLLAPKNDDLVDPKRNTQQITEKLKKLDVNVTEKIYENVSHVTIIGALAWPLRFKAPVLDDIEQFIKQ